MIEMHGMRDRLLRTLPLLAFVVSVLSAAAWANNSQLPRPETRPHSSSASDDLSPNRASMELTNADRAAIRTVIEHQLKAFRDDDAEKAFSFASPGIQDQFGDAEQFMAMVKASYPPVYRPRSVMFEDIIRIEGKVAQQVVVMGPNGGLFNAVYVMQLQPGDRWRINGCFLVPIEGQSV